jgi:hypothetical protein
MKYILEIYHEGDCIEQREKDVPFMAPAPGEQIHLSFQNTNYSLVSTMPVLISSVASNRLSRKKAEPFLTLPPSN